ncbi:serine hydrolase domain-containing protein [Aeromicrobium sp. CTD01-1L150]|uniref:serine hydrolase domain-containing protein n=1 Tax=Aeromicrobium sp. CTD01-1L150 TaxID=3341830 RepID=UPI0035C22EAD
MTLRDDTTAALERRLAAEQSDQRLPSVAAAVVRSGQLVWSSAVGHTRGRAGSPVATTDTQYRIGSLTKTFVAVQVMRLRDEGALELSDAIGRHLGELDLPVSIAQLLSHTSGLQAETSGPWWERTPGDDWPALLASRPTLVFTPGTRFHYSNVGFAVLGELVARLRGRPWPEVLREEILAPLGMHRTTFRPETPSAPGLAVHPFADLLHAEPEHDALAMAPAGQLWSTADDLARWAAFTAGHTGDVLSATTLAQSQRPVALWDDPTNAWATAHALGWQVSTADGRRFVGHGGSMPGFLAQLWVDVETGDGVVVLANATSGLGPVASDLLRTLADREPHASTPWTAQAGHRDDLDLVGDWFWGTVRFTASLSGDQLRLGQPGIGRGARFERTHDGWRGLEGYYSGETLTVHRGADGTPRQLDLASFVFTRAPYEPGTDVPGGLDEMGWS